MSAEAPQGQAWFCLKKTTKINPGRGSQEVTVLLLSLTQHGSPLPGGHLASLHFFSCVVDKNLVWLRNICAAAPAQSHGSDPALQICAGNSSFFWDGLWGAATGDPRLSLQGNLGIRPEVNSSNKWTDGHYGLGVDLMFYHLLAGLCSRIQLLEVRQGLN